MRLTTFAISMSILTACQAFAAPQDTLINCIAVSPQKFSPAITNDANDFNASSQQVYNRLLDFKAGKIEVEPSLAEKWEISEDGLSYIFHLRKGVKFHSNQYFAPSRDFNADDVLFSFQRQYDKTNPYHTVSGATYFYYNWMNLPKILKNVEKIDDYTVKITLNAPNTPFLTTIAMDFLSIYSKEYADKLLAANTPELLDQQPIGTGPFIFQTYQTDQAVRYKANPDYWQSKASIEKLIFAITPDAGTRLAKLRAGECDVIELPNISDIASIKQDNRIILHEREGLNLGYIALNTTKEALNNVKIRQALHHAIDKKAIVEAVYQGGGSVAINPFPSSVLGYNSDLPQYTFDLEKAKALLVEAGYPDGFETEIWVQPVVRPTNPNPRRTAEMIQTDWAKIGVKAKLVTHDWADFNKRTRAGEFSTGTYGWASRNGDPDNFLLPLFSKENIPGTNYSRWVNEEFEALIQKAAQVQDKAERARLYQQAVEIFQQNTPILPIAHSINYVPVANRVQGFVQSPFGYTAFYPVKLAK